MVNYVDDMADKKRRLNLTLPPEVWEKLRETMFRRDKPANFLIEQALRKYLMMPSPRRTNGHAQETA